MDVLNSLKIIVFLNFKWKLLFILRMAARGQRVLTNKAVTYSAKSLHYQTKEIFYPVTDTDVCHCVLSLGLDNILWSNSSISEEKPHILSTFFARIKFCDFEHSNDAMLAN